MEEGYRPGSAADFERLYQATYPRLLGTLVLMLGDRAAAEDCLQEAYLKAFRNWAKWQPSAPAEAWLHRIAVNQGLSYRRWAKLREVGEVVRRFGRPSDEDPMGDSTLSSDFVKALQKLPPKQVVAIVLRHYHGYTSREIAQSLGVPERTVASRLAAARERLRKELGPGYRDSDAEAAGTTAEEDVSAAETIDV